MEKNKEVAEVMRELCRPFPFDELEIKSQSVAGNRALAIPYFDARAVMNRLDEVLGPENWSGVVTPIDGGFLYSLQVQIGDIVIIRTDGADTTNVAPIKGGISDAMKRAYSALGNRTLYDVEFGWMDCLVSERNGKTYFKAWTPESLKAMRIMYDSTLNRLSKHPVEKTADDRDLLPLEEAKAYIREMFGKDWEKLKPTIERRLKPPLTEEKVRIAATLLYDQDCPKGDVRFADSLLSRL